MARKPSTSLQYFPIKVNNHADTCIEALIDEFGIYVELFVLKVHDIIYNHSFYVQLDIILLRKLLRRTGFDEATALKMLDRMMEYEILDRELYDKYGILTGKEIQEVFFEATVRRKEFPSEREYFLIDTSCYERKHQSATRSRQAGASVADNGMQESAEQSESDDSDYSANNSAVKPINANINSINVNTSTQRERETKRERERETKTKKTDSIESESKSYSSSAHSRTAGNIASGAAHNDHHHPTIKNKKCNSGSSAVANGGADKTLYDYPTIAEKLYCEPRWCAGVMAQFGITKPDLKQLMLDFLADAAVRGTDEPKTRAGFAAHFANWLRKKWEFERKNLSQDLAAANNVSYRFEKSTYNPVAHADVILNDKRGEKLNNDEYCDMIREVLRVAEK